MRVRYKWRFFNPCPLYPSSPYYTDNVRWSLWRIDGCWFLNFAFLNLNLASNPLESNGVHTAVFIHFASGTFHVSKWKWSIDDVIKDEWEIRIDHGTMRVQRRTTGLDPVFQRSFAIFPRRINPSCLKCFRRNFQHFQKAQRKSSCEIYARGQFPCDIYPYEVVRPKQRQGSSEFVRIRLIVASFLDLLPILLCT